MRSGAASNKKSHICTFFISGFKFHTGLEMTLRIREFKKKKKIEIQSMPSSKSNVGIKVRVSVLFIDPDQG